MSGIIELEPGATWKRVRMALADGCYYLDQEDGLIHVFEDEAAYLAVIYPIEPELQGSKGVDDVGFVLGKHIRA